MSTLFQQQRPSLGSTSQELCPSLMEMREELPELFGALVGVPTDGTQAAVPAHSLCLFVTDGRLRFCLSSKESDSAAFGEVVDATKGLAGVEQAIVERRLGWKKERRRKLS